MRAPGSPRLRGIAAHLAPTAGEQVHDAAVAEVAAARLLTEEQLAQFVVNGFIAIELTDMPPSFHEEAAAVALAHADSWAGGDRDALCGSTPVHHLPARAPRTPPRPRRQAPGLAD